MKFPDSVLHSAAVNLLPTNVREQALRDAPEARDRAFELALQAESPLVAVRKASFVYARTLFGFLPETTPPWFSTDHTLEIAERMAAEERDRVFATVLDMLSTHPNSEMLPADEKATYALRYAADAYANVLVKHLSHRSDLLGALFRGSHGNA